MVFKKRERYVLSSLQTFPASDCVQEIFFKKEENKFSSSEGSEIGNPRFTCGIFHWFQKNFPSLCLNFIVLTKFYLACYKLQRLHKRGCFISAIVKRPTNHSFILVLCNYKSSDIARSFSYKRKLNIVLEGIHRLIHPHQSLQKLKMFFQMINTDQF